MSQSIQYPRTANGAQGRPKLIESCSDYFPAILFNYDMNRGEVACVNNKLSEFLGFFPEEFELLQGGLIDLAYVDDVPVVKGAVEKFHSLSEGESYTFTARFSHKTGGYRYLKCTCTRYQLGAVMIIAENVTAHVKLEEDSMATRQLFDETEKLLLFGTWSWNPTANKLEWTEGMYHLLGYTPENAPELSIDFYFQHVVPEHVDRVKQVIEQASHTGDDFEIEYVIKTKDGVEKYVYTKGKALLDIDLNLKKVVGITRNITNKKNFEKERDRSIRELNRSNKELEEFAYVASHDLHEPLRKILTFTERLRTKFTESLGDDGKMYLERVWASADNMRKLIDNLLEFSKISRGTRSFVACNLSGIIAEVISDQELRIEETSTSLKCDHLPTVQAVPSELRQLFNNLIGNALKFRKKDVNPSIQITAKKLTHMEKSDLLLPFNEVYYQIDVRDNGIGFEPVYAEKIFEIFQRLHGKAEYSGSGIGLSICKKIVENHDGIIYATGEPGVGSIFSVILPEKQFK
jgi:PAS domain S-box-containing protein